MGLTGAQALPAAPISVRLPLEARRTRGAGRRLALGAATGMVLHGMVIAAMMVQLGRPATRFDYADTAVQVELAPRPAPLVKPKAPPPPPPKPRDPPPMTPHRTPPVHLTQVPPLLIPAADPAPPPPRREAPPPPPALPVPEAPARPLAGKASFQGLIMARLEQFRRYPPSARARREQGVVMVRFTMNRAGKVLSATVDEGSGSSVLDREAVDTVRRAQPLPAIPTDMADPLQLVVAIEFFVR